MQNEQHNTLIQREKCPPLLLHCSSVSYTVLLQCNTSPAAHGQPRAGGALSYLLVKDSAIKRGRHNESYALYFGTCILEDNGIVRNEDGLTHTILPYLLNKKNSFSSLVKIKG